MENVKKCHYILCSICKAGMNPDMWPKWQKSGWSADIYNWTDDRRTAAQNLMLTNKNYLKNS